MAIEEPIPVKSFVDFQFIFGGSYRQLVCKFFFYYTAFI